MIANLFIHLFSICSIPCVYSYIFLNIYELYVLILPFFQFQLLSHEDLTTPPTAGVYVGNLALHNACWDGSRLVLGPDVIPTTMPVVWFKPVSIATTTAGHKQDVYKCPVYLSGTSECLDSCDVITTVALPCDVTTDTWTERRVHLACIAP